MMIIIVSAVDNQTSTDQDDAREAKAISSLLIWLSTLLLPCLVLLEAALHGSRINHSLRLCHKKTSGDARYLYKKNNKINETFPHAHVMTHAVQCSLIKAD